MSCWTNIAFILRILEFLMTYYFMIDYLFISNVSTELGSGITIGGILLITILYYPLRGKNLVICDKCEHKSGFKTPVKVT